MKYAMRRSRAARAVVEALLSPSDPSGRPAAAGASPDEDEVEDEVT
jgi:hypothetical protein